MSQRARGSTTMFELTRRVRVGLVAVAALTTMTTGLFVAQTEATTAGAVECYERFVGAPVNERGIQCPGEPAIWKSYTFASSDIGYYTETVTMGNDRAQVRLGYRHVDGRVAVAIMDCTAGGCTESYWNGEPFPFQG